MARTELSERANCDKENGQGVGFGWGGGMSNKENLDYTIASHDFHKSLFIPFTFCKTETLQTLQIAVI